MQAFAVISLDGEGRVTVWSEGAARVFGFSAEEVRGRYFGFIFTPEDQEARRPQQELETAIRHGSAQDDMWLQKRGGRFYAVGFTTVHKTSSGQPDAFTKVIHDLTGIKSLEEELRRSRDLAQAIVETVRQPLIVLGADLRVKFVNEAFLAAFRVHKAATEGRLLYELGNGQWDIPELRRLLSDVLPRESVVKNYLVEHDFPFVGRRAMLLDARRMAVAGQAESLILLALEDVTERRHFQESLKEGVRDRTEDLEKFAYTVAHDLRAPARAIRGLADMILEDEDGRLTPEATGLLHRIAHQADHMQTLIRDLLQYAMLGRGDLPKGVTKLDAVVAEVLDAMSDVLRSRNARVDVRGPLPAVLGHVPLLLQVVRNLLENAVKFVPEDRSPEIRVTAEEGDGRVRVVIEDNGIGIRPEHHDRIFRVFERLHTQEEYGGTGVGLAIVKRGVERLGGRVGLDSDVGRGSRFWLELPSAAAEEAA